MKTLLTGYSGFLGRAICSDSVLHETIITLGRSSTADYSIDLSSSIPDLRDAFELVIHAAGKAHTVPRSLKEKQEFFDVNVKGTVNLLAGLSKSPRPKYFVFISTVAVYGKVEGHNISSDAPLNARDAYGMSKIQAEKIVWRWCEENNVLCTILRLPLLVGPNPPGNLKDMIRGIKKGYYFNIGTGKARKSMLLVEDVAKIIPVAAVSGGIYNLTDGYHPSFCELADIISRQLGCSKSKSIPAWLAKIMAKLGDIAGSRVPINSEKVRKIMADLTFDDSKARKALGWQPTPVLEGFKIW